MQQEPTWITEKRRDSIGVLAGALGYYGRAYDLWTGPLRADPAGAWRDAVFAAECIDQSPSGVLV